MSMHEDEATGTPAPAPAAPKPEPLRFTGTGSEYFGIWSVNLLLTILTLGIYAAWAKVRSLQYFYRHTELAGSSFDFHGSAVRILIGRILAIVLFGLYNYSVRLQSTFTLIAIATLAVIMPWLLRNSFRFRLYNASWRGTRFHFRGGLGGAYRVFLLNGFLTLITGIMVPFAHQQLKQWQHGNSWFGQTQCSFTARAGQFYRAYLLLGLGVGILIVLVGSSGIVPILFAASHSHNPNGPADPGALTRAILIIYGGLILLGISIGPAFQALIQNLIWNNTRIGEHRIECQLSAWRLIWITVTNLLFVVVTLGLFIPWATVRLRKYRVESMRLIPAGDLQEFVAAEPESPGALGEEAAAVFDFDIAL